MSYRAFRLLIALPLLIIALYAPWRETQAEFALNFQSNPNVVASIANWGCSGTGGGGGGGGMGGGGGGMGGMAWFGPGCGSDYFLQQLVSDGGVQYYHVIVGNPAEDNFALEFYMRTGACCWWPSGGGGGMGGGGGGGGMGGGNPAPYSSSYGDVNDILFNAWQPLSSNADKAGNGTGNPNRVYMRQINNDPQMRQEFVKNIERNKPRIIQTIADGSLTSTFDLDMRNGSHSAFTTPASFVNITTIAGIGSFDANANAQKGDVTAGRYTYSANNPKGVSHGDSYGSYNYGGGFFDVHRQDWLAFCNPADNPDHNCNFGSGGGGMMGGGGGGGGGGGMGGR